MLLGSGPAAHTPVLTVECLLLGCRYLAQLPFGSSDMASLYYWEEGGQRNLPGNIWETRELRVEELQGPATASEHNE